MLQEEDNDLFYQHKSCTVCNGFYGSCFGQPVCSTCHMFLFPLDINATEVASFVEKCDSGDSGNEEPNTEMDFYEKKDYDRAFHMNLTSRTERGCDRVQPKVDRLAERVSCLTVGRDYRLENIPEGLVESLPPEVLLVVFQYLDDISLSTARNVCMRWRQLLDSALVQQQWQAFTKRRWPLFMAQYRVRNWWTVYMKLLESTNCRYCLETMVQQTVIRIEENSWRQRRLNHEERALRLDPPEGIQAMPLDRQYYHWQASITGPQGSPYEGGIFYLYLQIPPSYPMRPPIVRFITKIYHPNISRHGDIGLDSILHNWSLALTISKVLISIQSLLTDPYCRVCMEPSIGELYVDDYAKYTRLARTYTAKYAMLNLLSPADLPLALMSKG